MSENQEPTNWPTVIADGIQTIGRGITPECIRALNRLLGATADTGVAKLKQITARIDAQTRSYVSVEEAVSKAVVDEVGTDEALAKRAASALIHKAYRQQVNREAVAAALVEELSALPPTDDQIAGQPPELDEDWLNIFERYADDASTERMQRLWGRVLAGEIRKPGRFSARTLRFLSEFSQVEGLDFAKICAVAFGDLAPKELTGITSDSDVTPMMNLETNGLIQGTVGLGLQMTLTFDPGGYAFLRESDLIIALKGTPGSKFAFPIVAITPLGQELMALIPNRDAKEVARKVANAIRKPEIEAAYLGRSLGVPGEVGVSEVLWQKDAQTIEGTVGSIDDPPLAAGAGR